MVNELLASMGIVKMVERNRDVIDDSSIPRNDDQNILDTRLEPKSDRHKDWLVQEQTALGKDFSNPVDMVINPPWNLPFLGAKGLTSPEQTATVEMVFSQPWTCTFLVAKGLTTPE
ncbi:hypothetical protein Tco_0431203 [Tanacetum coccineum]